MNSTVETVKTASGDGLDASVWFATDKLFVGGQWLAPHSQASLPIENPSTGQTIGQLARGGARDVDAAVDAARTAYDDVWCRTSAVERGRLLMRMSRLVEERVEALAMIEALDVGKPLRQSRNDARALARYFEFYAGAADKLMGHTIPYPDDYTVYTLRQPYGVAGIVIPWNYPMQILGRTLGASLAAGNCCVVKPAEDASVSTLAVAAIAQEAGLPPGVFNVVTGLGGEAGAALAAHSGIDVISFTGSIATGQRIQTAAAQNIVPVTLELGGKSPHIVFDDCDLDHAMPTLVGACMQNAGQTCSAASRVLVQRGLYDEVRQRMAAIYAGLEAGPAVDDYDLGPLVSRKQMDLVGRFLEQGRAELNVAAEGTIAAGASGSGHFVRATLFADVAPEHRLAQEEIFGPVQVLIPFDDEKDAVRIANGTAYGLVAGIWTRDGGRQMRMAKRLRAGQVFINNYGAGGGVELPFGGMGKSGHGREKGFEALYGFTQLKTVTAYHG
jgi:aldehyde dehydrogenase (NAD+)